jgi:preprotein translocase subunit SecA
MIQDDNQLRGRCGRQGDPGTSRFFSDNITSFVDQNSEFYANSNDRWFPLESKF